MGASNNKFRSTTDDHKLFEPKTTNMENFITDSKSRSIETAFNS